MLFWLYFTLEDLSECVSAKFNIKQVDEGEYAGREFSNEEIEIISTKVKGVKVRDHCHFTGHYRGPAHQTCNLKVRNGNSIPVFFHNLTGYDAHHIFNNLKEDSCVKSISNIIAKSLEKYLAFTMRFDNTKYRADFRDSLNFLPGSLDKVVKNLKDKADKEGGDSISRLFSKTLKHFGDKYGPLNEDDTKLLLGKGIFPYSYFSSFEVMKEGKLPPKEAFKSTLRGTTEISEVYTFYQRKYNKNI